LHARATTKDEAIRAAGRVLVETGCIEPAYIESMIGREQQANTYLAHGIAIPHGMSRDRGFIRRTGIAVVQFPDGVEWMDGQVARLVVGIAATSDEHLELLAALTDVLDDPETANHLARTSDPGEIIAALNPPGERVATVPTRELRDACSLCATLRPGAGLHARPATHFVTIAGAFAAEIRVEFDGKTANGKSMASLLKLGAEGGATLRLTARGEDAEAALAALKQAVESGLGDEHERSMSTHARIWKPVSNLHAVSGVCASPGLAIGSLHHFRTEAIRVEDTGDVPSSPEVERRTLGRAVEEAKGELDELYSSMTLRLDEGDAAIFRAQAAFLEDTELLDDVRRLIDAGQGAARSWQQAIGQRVTEIERAADVRIAGRAMDLQDVGQRVLRWLVPDAAGQTRLPTEPCILVAEDFAPSQTARFDPGLIRGIITAGGGPTSHTAIIARSLGIPALVGAGPAVLDLPAGALCILEATGGRLYPDPGSEDLDSARRFQIEVQHQQTEDRLHRYRPALMTDGHRMEVVANIGTVPEAAAAVEAGAEGVGLLRTEFLFLGRERAPTEEEQFEAYAEMARALHGLPLIVRTLDIGGDKVVPYLPQPKEDNPFLGVRGIRLCLRTPELFRSQLRAIYRTSVAASARASIRGAVKILFPMITTLEDLRAAKALAEEVRIELGVPPVEIGIMVEVPSVAMLAAEFARECDFFSVGSNDLTQYTLAMDRLHPQFAQHQDALHPAVLRLIEQTVRGAQSAGKWVGVCGDLAGSVLGASVLAGLGVTELSMSLPSLASVKAHLRGTSLSDARALARRALACGTAADVHALGG